MSLKVFARLLMSLNVFALLLMSLNVFALLLMSLNVFSLLLMSALAAGALAAASSSEVAGPVAIDQFKPGKAVVLSVPSVVDSSMYRRRPSG
jgi:hypothetical protein